jgi:cysteinyl-tRNA synthetase
MTLAHLGVPIDLHAGGKDLVFPHHTNEIAQSVAAVGDGKTAESFCRYWMHNGFVEIDAQKMSKSLGNFFTIRDVLAKFDGEVMRLFLLGTHYRNPINFSDAILQEAERRLRYLYKTLEKVDRLAAGASPAGRGGEIVEAARRALDDDFNAPQVLAVLADAFTEANALADRKGKKGPEDRATLAAFARDAREIGRTLGLLQRTPPEAIRALRAKGSVRRGIDAAEVEGRIAERAEARRAKDFARGDAITTRSSRVASRCSTVPRGRPGTSSRAAVSGPGHSSRRERCRPSPPAARATPPGGAAGRG